MRKIDESRAANYIRKHSNYKKWLAFVLCLSLLTGTITLYILNKPATAMTEDSAESIGAILETASSADEAEMIREVLENKAATDGSGDGSDDELFGEFNDDDDESGSDTDADNSDDADENEDGEDAANTDDTEETEGEQKADDTALTEEEAAAAEATKEVTEETEAEEDETSDDELTQDVVLTVSYVDTDGEKVADEKEISLEDSIDLTSNAPSFEGYTFDKATFDGDVITKITVLKNADDIRYYEVELKDGDTKEIKKDATVVLTYVRDEEKIEADASVTLTAKYLDKNGEEIQDSEEISFAKETSIDKDNAPEIDGYFFTKASYDGKEIVKVTPVEAEAEETEEEIAEEDTEEQAETVSVSAYEFTTADGELVEITEDAEIEFTYLKASDKTEFTFVDSKVTVTAKVNGNNVFPEGIELKATEVTKDSTSYNYGAYMDALNENAETIAEEAGQDQANEFTEDNTLLYDIAFVYEGKEIQPTEGSVTVGIEFKKNQLTEDLAASSEEEIAVVHLPIKEEVKEENEIVNTEDAVNLTAGDIEVITLSDASAAVEEDQKVEFETENFSIFAVLAYQHHDTGTDTFKTVLGDAVNFGYVADTIQVNESETNFAVNRILSNGSQSGNDMTNPVEQSFIVAKSDVEMRIKGYDAYFIIPTESASKIKPLGNTVITLNTEYSEKELNTVVNDMLEYVRDASADLATRDSNVTLQKNLEGQFNGKYVVDIYDLDDGSEEHTYYVNLSTDEFSNINEEKLWINKRDTQTIVFNVPNTGDLMLHKYWVSNDNWETKHITDSIAGEKGKQATSEQAKFAQTIIWNFINANSVTTGTPVVGVFIAGNKNATWKNTRTSAGWAVFPNIEIYSGEWHNTYQDVEKLSEKAVFQAYKNVDNLPSEVSGFKFALYRQNGDGWEKLQEVENDKHDIVFAPITYGDAKNKQSDLGYQYVKLEKDQEGNYIPKNFIYKITETATKVPYKKDSTEFYAKVTVSYVEESSIVVAENQQDPQNIVTTPKRRVEMYRVSAPTYYEDVKCTKEIGSIPSFNNITDGTISFTLFKHLNGTTPDKQFKFRVQVLDGHNVSGYKGTFRDAPNGNITNTEDQLYYSVTKKKLKAINPQTLFEDKEAYFLISEKPVEEQDESVKDVTFDSRKIIVKVDGLKSNNPKYHYYIFDSVDPPKGWEKKYAEYVRNILCKNAPEIDKENAIFENTCDAKATIQVKKNFVGDWPEGLGFMFILTPKGGVVTSTGSELDADEIPTPDPKIEYVYGDGRSTHKDVVFKEISYDTPGTYKYEISEEAKCYNAEGEVARDDIQFDTKKIYALVTVTTDMASYVEYYSNEACTAKLEGDAVSFNNALITRLKVNKEWTQNGGTPENSEFKTPIYIRVWRSTSVNGEKELLKWDTLTNKVSNSESATSVLMLSTDNSWSIELLPDKIHPEGSTEYYRYYVQEVVKTGNDEYKEKTEFVTYSSSYNNLTGKDWQTVYAYADPRADSRFTLTVTNEIGSNVLPSTGGMGDIPYMATGLGTAVVGLVGAKAYSKKKKKDDEE